MKPVSLVSIMVSLGARAWFLPGRVILLRWVARRLNRPIRRIRVGRVDLTLDLRDPFQAAMALGAYEPEVVRWFGRILRPGDVCVDVGANTGYHAARALTRVGSAGRCHLFEPDPRSVERLHEMIESAPDDIRSRIDLVPGACSDVVGSKALHLGLDGAISTLVSEVAECPDREPVDVACTTLDLEFERWNVDRIRLVKIDIEGHELYALRGMEALLSGRRIDFIVVECNPFVLDKIGFAPFHLHSVFHHFGYVGVNGGDRRVTADDLRGSDTVNYLYAKSEGDLRSVVGDATFGVQPEIETERLLDARFREAWTPGHPGPRKRLIVRMAAEGRAVEAIREAERLLDDDPANADMRGHLAFWLHGLGRNAEALAHLDKMIFENPEDLEARRIRSLVVEGLRAGPTAADGI